ncbi:MAG TPA: aliphatic sulfonate ABC transporter substrate-binding protein [Rhodopila sp.]|jgi:aliphatic sulfonates family ABC transporter substrate-binding protein|nr:aliphatic sulfonate ABC transporter substrate-binding protein [Rhodopila sp.]
MTLNRRQILAAGLLLPLPAIQRARAADAKTLRVGFQKGEPLLMTAKTNKDLETLLGPKGIGVEWIEFQFGPPMLEAMRVGSIDVGAVGDTPPVFAQAARADLLYIAANLGSPQSILLPPGSKIQTLADLKGKKLAFGRGSSGHDFALMALEKAGLRYDEIEPVYLGPADAGAAFERGAVDAWSIWEPYASLFATRPGVRTLVSNKDIGEQYSFIIGSGPFVRANPALTAMVVQAFTEAATQASAHRADVAVVLAGATGIPQAVWARALVTDPFKVQPMSDDIIRSQQKVADRFRAQNLVPVDIKVADIVWRPGV